jgi:hypothetical protein
MDVDQLLELVTSCNNRCDKRKYLEEFVSLHLEVISSLHNDIDNLNRILLDVSSQLYVINSQISHTNHTYCTSYPSSSNSIRTMTVPTVLDVSSSIGTVTVPVVPVVPVVSVASSSVDTVRSVASGSVDTVSTYYVNALNVYQSSSAGTVPDASGSVRIVPIVPNTVSASVRDLESYNESCYSMTSITLCVNTSFNNMTMNICVVIPEWKKICKCKLYSQTKGRGELLSVIKVMQKVPSDVTIKRICTRSEYVLGVCNNMRRYSRGFKRNGSSYCNKDLLAILEPITRNVSVSVVDDRQVDIMMNRYLNKQSVDQCDLESGWSMQIIDN